MGAAGQRHALAALPAERDPKPTVQEAGWASGPGWMVFMPELSSL